MPVSHRLTRGAGVDLDKLGHTSCLLAAVAAAAITFGVAPSRADPNLPYGPNTCVQGLVWREARVGDAVCVRPEDRTRTAQENAAAADRRDPNGPYGPQSCKQGSVWREAFDGDTVCVTPDTRRENLDWNGYRCGTVLGEQRHAGYCGPYPPPPRDIG